MSRSIPRLLAEAAVAKAVFAIFRVLPLDAASALGGWLGRVIGYRLPVTRRARRNLARAFPTLGEAEREALLKRMWDNLGRTAGEFPHIDSFRFGPGERIEIVGLEHLEAARATGRGIICFGAHCGNWELFGAAAAVVGMPFNVIYRAPNNPYLARQFVGNRNLGGEMIPKGAAGARRALELLRRGQTLGMLVDQKMNDGIPVPFLGRDAMTAPALAQLALKFRCTALPGHVIRVKGTRMRLVIDPPLVLPEIADRHAAILATMTEVNRIIEGWVRANPDQWLWVHRRWPD